MPDQLSSFEPALEADLQHLAAEVASQRERSEMKGAAEAELIKEAIRAFPASEKGPEAGRTGAQTAGNTSANAGNAGGASVFQNPLPAYAESAPAEVKLEIEFLLETAFREGLGKALAAAKKSPYFVQDAFHDALAGKLYPELQKRGIVK
jgi:hypothetical protein